MYVMLCYVWYNIVKKDHDCAIMQDVDTKQPQSQKTGKSKIRYTFKSCTNLCICIKPDRTAGDHPAECPSSCCVCMCSPRWEQHR